MILVPLGLHVRIKVTALEYFIKVRTRLILGNDMEKDLARSVLKLIGWQPLSTTLLHKAERHHCNFDLKITLTWASDRD